MFEHGLMLSTRDHDGAGARVAAACARDGSGRRGGARRPRARSRARQDAPRSASSKQASDRDDVSQFRNDRLPLAISITWNASISAPATWREPPRPEHEPRHDQLDDVVEQHARLRGTSAAAECNTQLSGFGMRLRLVVVDRGTSGRASTGRRAA